MKHSINSLTTAVFTIASMCAFMISCSPSNDEPPCLAVVTPDTLRFNVFDKETKVDLFFSDSPAYDTTEVQLLKKGVDGALEPAHKGIAKGWEDVHFFSTVYPDDTLFLKIADQPLDTIAFIGKPADTPCPQTILDKVTFNSEAPELNAHGRIIPLYRKE
jgi:hypothetical protein